MFRLDNMLMCEHVARRRQAVAIPSISIGKQGNILGLLTLP